MDKDPEITNSNVEKTYTDPVTGKFIPGNPGGGRPKGSLDFKTKWEIFIDKVAKSNNLTPQEIDEQLFAIGFKKAKEGDYSFYRDIHDRLYGKAPQTIDLNTKGEGEVNEEVIKKAKAFDEWFNREYQNPRE